jgi:hypothetical protein
MPSLTEFLGRLADALLELATAPVLVFVRLVGDDGSDDGGEYDVGFRPAESHPSELLAGFTAPPDWLALGHVSQGRAWPLPGGDAEEAGAVSLVVFATREGELISRVRLPSGRVLAEPPEYGLVAEALLGVFPDAPQPPARDCPPPCASSSPRARSTTKAASAPTSHAPPAC